MQSTLVQVKITKSPSRMNIIGNLIFNEYIEPIVLKNTIYKCNDGNIPFSINILKLEQFTKNLEDHIEEIKEIMHRLPNDKKILIDSYIENRLNVQLDAKQSSDMDFIFYNNFLGVKSKIYF